jgi:hypothetical protein
MYYITVSSIRRWRSRWDGVEGPNKREMENFNEFDASHGDFALTHCVSVIAVIVNVALDPLS